MSQLPAHLQNRTSKPITDSLVANLGTGSPPYISINANRFTLIDATGDEEPVPTHDPKLGPYLDCVIIDHNEHTSKIFYDKPYDPNAEGQAPACFSDNGLAPSRQSAIPQSPTCASCKWNVWGSKTSQFTGKGIKACHDVQKIAVMIPGDEVTFLMRIQPGSRKNFGAYMLKFKGTGTDISDVTTRMWFESQGVLNFRALNYIDVAAAQQREQVLVEKKTDLLIGRGDMPIQGLLAAPETQSSLPVQAAAHPAQIPATPPSPSPSVIPPQQATTMQPPAGGVAPASPTRRRRRTAQQPEQAPPAQPMLQTSAGPPDGIPPFLQRTEQPAQQGAFGIQNPVPPDPQVSAAVKSIFNS